MTRALFGPLALTPGAMSAARSGERPTGVRSVASDGNTTSPGFDSLSGSSPAACVTLDGLGNRRQLEPDVEAGGIRLDVTVRTWRSKPSNSNVMRYSPDRGSFSA